MERLALVVLILVACAGCNTIKKYKGVHIETDGSGKIVSRVESESASQTDWATKKMQLKYIQL